MRLNTAPNIGRIDDVYQWLVDAHESVAEEESPRLSARLVFILMNHVGDEAVIREAIALAVATSASHMGSGS